MQRIPDASLAPVEPVGHLSGWTCGRCRGNCQLEELTANQLVFRCQVCFHRQTRSHTAQSVPRSAHGARLPLAVADAAAEWLRCASLAQSAAQCLRYALDQECALGHNREEMLRGLGSAARALH